MSHQPAIPDDQQQTGLLAKAIKAWSKAQVLYTAPAWNGQPPARALAEEIAQSHPEYEPHLVSHLLDENQLVVGYSLMTLALMGSKALRDLPSAVLDRRSGVTLISGSMKQAMDLGGFARQLQKQFREAAESH